MLRLAFLSAVVSLVVSFAAAAAPIPLYNIYRAEDGFLLCYSGAAFPSLISGQLSNAFSLPQIVLGYGGLAIVATLLTVLGARNPHTDATGNSTRDSSNATGSPIHGTAS